MLKQAISPLSNSLPQERGLYSLSLRERVGERVKKSR